MRPLPLTRPLIALGWACAGVAGTLSIPCHAQDPAPAVRRPQPPLPPLARHPVELFRELLTATPERRDALLKGKSPEARDIIHKRLAEFEALPPQQRSDAEAQLRLAQFRFYLSPLLRMPAADRAARLALAPAEDRALLEERLRAWDLLDAARRRQLLDSEDQFHHFVRQPGADPARLSQVLASAGPAARPAVEAQFERWRSLPESERRQRAEAFQDFFSLTPNRQNRALDSLSEKERSVMEKTLERYARLPASERERCIAGFERFSSLTPAERDAFLRNAALWQAMTPDERAQWRRLVLNLNPPPLPPLPSQRIVSTNR